ILIKNAESLERAGQMRVLVLDKTGTLTMGEPAVTDVVAAPPWTQAALLQLAAALERGSSHPIARAIVRAQSAGEGGGAGGGEASEVRDVGGQGVEGRVGFREVVLGTPDFLASRQVGVPQADVAPLAALGRTLAALAVDGNYAGLIAVADRVREDSAAAVARLREAGLRVVMLTGDHRATAAAVADSVGIADWRAGVLPAGKADAVAALRKETAAKGGVAAKGACIGMAGDGINDAPALAAADVSFAMGAGADAAVEAADITLVRGSLHGVSDAIDLSRVTMAKIRQNFFFAFAYNVLGIPLAAFGMLDPVVAGAAMALSSVSVVSNSLLLKRWRPWNCNRAGVSGKRKEEP
ncbi:MAG: HAD-IC family P-type ATPase, partial [Azoarcus sp.]|nr:HAD-IC family P-type ATPase [Azoarcus sp.]